MLSDARARLFKEPRDVLPTVGFDDGRAVHVGNVRVLQASAQLEKLGKRGALLGQRRRAIVHHGGRGRALLGMPQAVLKKHDALLVLRRIAR